MTGSVFAPSGGFAAATVSETYCLGGPVAGCLGTVGSLSTYRITGFGTKLSDSVIFDPVSMLGVDKDIQVFAVGGGFATLSGMNQGVDQSGSIPEPFTSLLVGSAVFAMGVGMRRWRKKQ